MTGDTDRTADAGKTSASRQTFVSGKAAELAARESARRDPAAGQCRPGRDARRSPTARSWSARRAATRASSSAGSRPTPTAWCCSPRATSIRRARRSTRDGQGSPYPTYAFAAQIARVQVDLELGTTKVLEIVAAHDVGRAINPTQVEGQIQGGIAQGLGLALMEEYLPGRTENLHDYLIPTIGDVPRIEVHPDRGPGAARAVRRQGRRRARPDPDRARDPRRDPPRDRRARSRRCRPCPIACARRSWRESGRWLRPARSSAATPARCCAGSARARPAPATATPTSRASWSGSTRWW